MSINYKTTMSVLNKIHQLKSLNLIILPEGVEVKGQNDCYAYKAMCDDLKSDVAKAFSLNENPGIKQVCKLALAITQEHQNSYITEDQIKQVNDFFEFNKPITFDDVQQFSKRYI